MRISLRRQDRAGPLPPGVDHGAGNGDARRGDGHVVPREPARVPQLLLLQADGLAVVGAGEKSHHLRIGKGPGLVAEVRKVADVQARLLQCLAAGRLLQALADLQIPGDEGVEVSRVVLALRQEDALPAGDEHDHRRGDARIDRVAAGRADHGALGRAVGHLCAAAAAEARHPIPVGEVLRRSAQEGVRLGELAQGAHGAQRAAQGRLPGQVDARAVVVEEVEHLRLGRIVAPEGEGPVLPQVDAPLRKAEGLVLQPGRMGMERIGIDVGSDIVQHDVFSWASAAGSAPASPFFLYRGGSARPRPGKRPGGRRSFRG